jgi:hypothetical protein
MRLVIQQPNYFPWLGFFEQIASADLFLYLDSVQWIRQGRQHRTRLPSPGNSSTRHWLTVPVHGHGHREKPFRDIEVDHSRNWPKRHWETLRTIYGKAPHFKNQLEPVIRPFFERADERKFLFDLCAESVGALCEFLGLEAPTARASDFPATGVKSDRLIALCQEFSADEYYSGLGSTRYLDLSAFRAANIRVRWQHFRSLYPQDPLRSADLSALDWLALVSRAEILAALKPLPKMNTDGDIPPIRATRALTTNQLDL